VTKTEVGIIYGNSSNTNKYHFTHHLCKINVCPTITSATASIYWNNNMPTKICSKRCQ